MHDGDKGHGGVKHCAALKGLGVQGEGVSASIRQKIEDGGCVKGTGAPLGDPQSWLSLDKSLPGLGQLRNYTLRAAWWYYSETSSPLYLFFLKWK